LYDAIFTEDLKKQLKDVKNIIIVTGEGLRGIPFAALYDGKQYLVEKYRISIVPSLALSNFRESQAPSPVPSNQVLAMGASEFSPEIKQLQLGDLPNVERELRLITQGEKYYLNDDFTVENLVAARRQFKQPVLHIATHAVIDPKNTLMSGLYLNKIKLPLDIDTLRSFQLGENENNGIPKVSLMILSACQSAVDAPKADLGFAGLARSAGVNTVVATLWKVSDASTPILMDEFYKQLRSGTLTSEALQKAQISLLESREYSHPSYWAAFTLVGNPSFSTKPIQK